MTTRSLICIRIQVGCSSSSCCPGGQQQHTTQPCAFSDNVSISHARGAKMPSASQNWAPKGIRPHVTRSRPGMASSSLQQVEGEPSLEPKLCSFEIDTLRMRQAFQPPVGKRGGHHLLDTARRPTGMGGVRTSKKNHPNHLLFSQHNSVSFSCSFNHIFIQAHEQL